MAEEKQNATDLSDPELNEDPNPVILDDEEKKDENATSEEAVEEEIEEEEEEEQGPPADCPPCKSGAPAWMATFADMATLLMAFFVLILSFAHMNVPKYKEISGSLKSAFGVQRVVPIVEPPKADNIIAKQYKTAKVEPTLMKVLEEQTTDDPQPEDPILKTKVNKSDSPNNSDVDIVKKALAKEIAEGKVDLQVKNNKLVVKVNTDAVGGIDGEGTKSNTGSNISQQNLEIYAKVASAQAEVESSIEVEHGSPSNDSKNSTTEGTSQGFESELSVNDQLEKIKADLSTEIQQGLAEVEKIGNQILVRLADQGAFASGYARLQQGFIPVLQKVANSLVSTSGQIKIEGHTDDVPIAFSERFRTNWDLSAARSAAVADYFLTNSDISDGRVTVSGYADTKPIASNETSEGRSRNRRIEIIVGDS